MHNLQMQQPQTLLQVSGAKLTHEIMFWIMPSMSYLLAGKASVMNTDLSKHEQFFHQYLGMGCFKLATMIK